MVNKKIIKTKKGEHMSEYTSIRIRKDIAEKLQIIKKENNCKSNNELLEQLIPKAINENYQFTQEQPLFHIGQKPITWTTIKQSTVNTTWSDGNDEATIIFKDKYGAFIRFIIENEVYLEYYHFI